MTNRMIERAGRVVLAALAAALLAMSPATGLRAQTTVPGAPVGPSFGEGVAAGSAAAARGALDRARSGRPMRTDRAQAFEGGVFEAAAPEPWLQQDPADSLYRSARDALNRREFQRAAELFGEIRARHPRSGYVADSYYFQAFALQRLGGAERERQALALLDQQRERHPSAASMTDADQLRQRIAAASAAGSASRPGSSSAAGAQQVACSEEDQELRAAALQALISMEGERSLPLLRDILGSRDPCVTPMRRQAVFLIQRALGDDAVDILFDLAHRTPDPDREVREQAVFWLSRVQTDASVTALETILSQSQDASVQEQAVFALSRQGSARAIGILRSYAERGDAPRRVREQAIFWLGKDDRNGGAAYLRDLYPTLTERELKEQVIHAMAQSETAESRAWLLARARDTSEDVEVRKNALFWAERAGMTLADLQGFYESTPERELREHLIFVISRMDGPESVDWLMRVASEETDRTLREQAVFWLGRSDDPRAGEFLRRLVLGGGA